MANKEEIAEELCKLRKYIDGLKDKDKEDLLKDIKSFTSKVIHDQDLTYDDAMKTYNELYNRYNNLDNESSEYNKTKKIAPYRLKIINEFLDSIYIIIGYSFKAKSIDDKVSIVNAVVNNKVAEFKKDNNNRWKVIYTYEDYGDAINEKMYYCYEKIELDEIISMVNYYLNNPDSDRLSEYIQEYNAKMQEPTSDTDEIYNKEAGHSADFIYKHINNFIKDIGIRNIELVVESTGEIFNSYYLLYIPTRYVMAEYRYYDDIYDKNNYLFYNTVYVESEILKDINAKDSLYYSNIELVQLLNLIKQCFYSHQYEPIKLYNTSNHKVIIDINNYLREGENFSYLSFKKYDKCIADYALNNNNQTIVSFTMCRINHREYYDTIFHIQKTNTIEEIAKHISDKLKDELLYMK